MQQSNFCEQVESKTLTGKAKPLGAFPHVKCAGNFVFISGTSSRRVDDSFAGVLTDEAGNKLLDIREQTRAVLENIQDILESASINLKDLVEVTTFLVDMDDFGAYNEVYGQYFDSSGPTRTTVAVKQLPHPDLLIEIKAIAYRPTRS